ncbi:MAG: hypothetical protein JWM32_3087 [Verrucomicrobia bacterium]|nr:hypothetical protein [Verrucomicrobiota bacterium]
MRNAGAAVDEGTVIKNAARWWSFPESDRLYAAPMFLGLCKGVAGRVQVVLSRHGDLSGVDALKTQ